jgi:hypothetical protein
MDRVYEIGRIFRNEGMDPKHNPEFTTVELYEAYTDFHGMMDIAEGVLSSAAQKLLGSYQVEWMGEQIDLTPGWPRLTMIDAVKQFVGIDFAAVSDDAAAVAAAKAAGVELADTAEKTWGSALYACFDQKVEEKLVQPTFITMYPVEVSPLTKRSPGPPPHRAVRAVHLPQRDGQRLLRAQRPHRPAPASSSRWRPGTGATTRPRCWTRISSPPWNTACRPPAAWASASTGASCCSPAPTPSGT